VHYVRASGAESQEVTGNWSGWPARIPGPQVLADSAHGTAEARSRCLRPAHLGVVKPIPQRTLVEDRFGATTSFVDEIAGQVTCSAAADSAAHADYRPSCATAQPGRHFTLHDTRPRLGAVHRTPTSRNVRFQTTYRQNPAYGRTLHRLAGTGATENCATAAQPKGTGGCTTGARVNLRRLIALDWITSTAPGPSTTSRPNSNNSHTSTAEGP
jgi:hypothetical protein